MSNWNQIERNAPKTKLPDSELIYSWDLPLNAKIKICEQKLCDRFDVLIKDNKYIYVYSEDFDCFYNDEGDNSLGDLLNGI